MIFSSLASLLPHDHVECVGGLLVDTHDLQELSESKRRITNTTPDECVGSLLVHAADVQELSKKGAMSPEDVMHAAVGTPVNLQKRISVGTLLLPPSYSQPSNDHE